MRTTKLSLSVLLTSFAIMVIGVHETGRFFPWAHGFILIFGLTGLVFATAREIHFPAASAVIVVAAISYRVFVYLSPNSIIGVDPDGYAVTLHQVITLGTTSALADGGTYATLSAIYLFSGSFALVTDFRGQVALVGIPIAMGILLPLGAIVLARRLGVTDSHSVFAGTLGAITALGIHFSYWPVAQALAIFIWVPLLILLVIAVDTGDRRAVVGAAVCLPVSTYSHKLSLFVPTIIVGAAIIAYVTRDRFDSRVRSHSNGYYIVPIIIFFILSGALFVLQWVFLTTFARSAILGKLIPLIGEPVDVVPTQPAVEAAAPGSPKILGILARRAHYLLLVPLVTLAGFVLWLYNRSTPVLLVIAAAAVPIAFISIAVIGPGIVPPRRMVFFGIIPFAVLLTAFAQKLSLSISLSRTTIFAAVFVPVLLAQAGTAPVAPDYPNEPRYYLSGGEVQAKSFMMDNTDNSIAMDPYYTGENVDVLSGDVSSAGESMSSSRMISMNDALLNQNIKNHGYSTVLLRQNVDVIRFGYGSYRLLWDPIETLSINKTYSRVYDNGESIGFVKIQ